MEAEAAAHKGSVELCGSQSSLHSNKRHLKETVNCTIHFGQLRQPRLLPCGHAFCQNCIQQWIDRCQYNKVHGSEEKVVFDCPLCRRPIKLTRGQTAASLPVAIAHQAIIDYVKKSKTAASSLTPPSTSITPEPTDLANSAESVPTQVGANELQVNANRSSDNHDTAVDLVAVQRQMIRGARFSTVQLLEPLQSAVFCAAVCDAKNLAIVFANERHVIQLQSLSIRKSKLINITLHDSPVLCNRVQSFITATASTTDQNNGNNSPFQFYISGQTASLNCVLLHTDCEGYVLHSFTDSNVDAAIDDFHFVPDLLELVVTQSEMHRIQFFPNDLVASENWLAFDEYNPKFVIWQYTKQLVWLSCPQQSVVLSVDEVSGDFIKLFTQNLRSPGQLSVSPDDHEIIIHDHHSRSLIWLQRHNSFIFMQPLDLQHNISGFTHLAANVNQQHNIGDHVIVLEGNRLVCIRQRKSQKRNNSLHCKCSAL